MVIRIEQGDPRKDAEKCPNEDNGSRTGRKMIDPRTHWKAKSKGSCDHQMQGLRKERR